MLFVGDDWAEDHHDVEIQDETGRKLAARRLPEGAAGIARLHELIGEHLDPGAVPNIIARLPCQSRRAIPCKNRPGALFHSHKYVHIMDAMG